MPQLSRRTFNTLNRYETVVFCEGTHPADFEMVELQDYQNSERSALQEILLTDGALGTGFLAVGSGLSNAVNITLGAALSQGQRLLLPDILHPVVGGAFVYAMPTATPVANRVDLIYLSVSIQDVTAVQDPNIEDPTLGLGAYREQVAYQILLAQGSTVIPALPQGSWGFPIATVQRYAGQAAVNAADVTDVRLIANLSDSISPGNLITVSATGGQFNSVVNALNSIPLTGPGAPSQSNPYVVLVYPGQYVSNTQIIMSSPYVSLIGLDPATTQVMVNCTGGTAFTISASNVAITNISLDLGPASTGNNTVLAVSTGVASASLNNCFVGPQAYAASQTNTFQGVSVGAGSTLNINDSSIWAENYGAGLSVSSSGGYVTADNLTITAMGVDAIVSAGSISLMYSTILSNRHSLNSSGPVNATDTSFTTATVGGNAATGTEGVLMSGSSTIVSMVECSIASTINQITATNVSLQWDGVSVGAFVVLSGTGNSALSDCLFTGISIATATAAFVGCTTQGGSNGISVVGFQVISGASVSIIGCNNTGNNAVTAIATNPTISNCLFFSVGVVDLIAVNAGAAPLISNCTLSITGGVNANAINIIDTVSNPVVTYCFFVGAPSSGYFVNGISGSLLTAGDNMSSGITAPPSLYNTANITIAYLATSVSETVLKVDNARGSAVTLGARMASSMTAAGFVFEQGLDQFRPYPTSVASSTVFIAVNNGAVPTPVAYYLIKSDGSTKLTPNSSFQTFGAVASASVQRVDLLYIDDSGTLSILPGTPAPSPVPPTYPAPGLVIAEIACNYTGLGSPFITAANITDVRPFLRAESPENVTIPVSGTPAAGYVPVASSGTAAAWSTQNVALPISGTPTAGQIPVASSGTAGAWANPPGATFATQFPWIATPTETRVLSTNYNNGLSRSLMVFVEMDAGALDLATGVEALIGTPSAPTSPTFSIFKNIQSGAANNPTSTATFIVPPGYSYIVNGFNVGYATWSEFVM